MKRDRTEGVVCYGMWNQLERTGKTTPSSFLIVGTAQQQARRRTISRRSNTALPLVPKEVRRKSFHKREPASPRVTCLGEIKVEKQKQDDKGRESRLGSCFSVMVSTIKEKRKLQKKTQMGKAGGSVWDGDETDKQKQTSTLAMGVVAKKSGVRPMLGELKQYESGRRELHSYEWKIGAYVVPVDRG